MVNLGINFFNIPQKIHKVNKDFLKKYSQFKENHLIEENQKQIIPSQVSLNHLEECLLAKMPCLIGVAGNLPRV